ncbi:MAG: PQQ-binding-like beta-propeller repeat protein [Micromonospora sp.]
MRPVIELGEMPHGEERDPPSDPFRPPGRTVRVGVLLAAVLLALGGAAPAVRRPPPVEIPAPQGASFLVMGDRLIIADGPGTVGRAARVVTGHRLPGPEPLWRFTLPAGDHVLGLSTVAGTLLVTSSPAGAGDTISTALDAATGAVRWRHPGYPVRTEPGGLLFETPRPDGTGTIRAVDPATGAPRWSLPLPGNGVAYRMGGRGVSQIVLVTAAGRVEVHDAGSGTLLRAGQVLPAADGVSYRFNQVVGDLLLMDSAPGTITAYGLDRLDRRWSVPVEPDVAYFQDCAGVVCVRDRITGARALDPTTGRTLWRRDGLLGLYPVGGRLLVAAADVGLEQDLSLREPTSGQVLARLGRWRIARGEPVDDRLLGLRRLPGDRTLVGDLDVPARQATVRAVLPGSWDDCAVGPGALVCLRPAGGLAVWPSGR